MRRNNYCSDPTCTGSRDLVDRSRCKGRPTLTGHVTAEGQLQKLLCVAE